MTGRPIVTPLFVDHVASGKARIVIDGLVDSDPRAVKVKVVDQHGGLLADITHIWFSARVDIDPNEPARWTLDGYLTSDTHLPQNAESVYVNADGDFDVELHACPHMVALGHRDCGWCGERVVSDDDFDLTSFGEALPEGATRT